MTLPVHISITEAPDRITDEVVGRYVRRCVSLLHGVWDLKAANLVAAIGEQALTEARLYGANIEAVRSVIDKLTFTGTCGERLR
jgi:hypothetical protein